MFGETDLLWNELQLDSLIDEDVPPSGAIFYNFNNKSGKAAVGLVSPSKSSNKLDGDELLLRNDRVGPQKIMEVFKKPAYSALINRYESLPHKPKTIQLNKLNLLADPIKGRYSRRLMDSEDSNDQPGESSKVSSNANKHEAIPRKAEVVVIKEREPSSAFFLTETDLVDESDNENENDHVAPHGGFAAALRGEVGVNRTRNNNNVAARRHDPLMKGNNRNNNRVSNKKQGNQINMPLRKSIKKAWDNAVVNNVKDSRNSRVSKSLISNVNKDQIIYLKKNDLWKKTASSGYGKKEMPRVTQQPKMTSTIKKGGLADGRREGRSTVTKQLIKGMRADNAQQAISRLHTNWDRNQPQLQPEQRTINPTGSDGTKANEELLFKDRFSLAGLESISETIVERAKRLQNSDPPPQKPIRKDMKRPQRLHASGTQSAPSQLQLPPQPQPQAGIHQVLLDEVLRSSSLVSKDDQHLSLPPISAPVHGQVSIPDQKKRDSRSDSATSREKAREAEREAASLRKPQLQQQQQRTKALPSTDSISKKSNKISITSLITRRIQKTAVPSGEEADSDADLQPATSKSPLRMFPPPIVALDGENDSLDMGNLSDELLLQEIKKDIMIMKSSPLAAAIPNKEDASLPDSLAAPTETELKEDLFQYEQIEKKALQLKSEAAQQLVHQMKKLGSHFSAAQKLSDQYKSAANEFSGLSFLS